MTGTGSAGSGGARGQRRGRGTASSRVIIIGAGLTGLVAAERLEAGGVEPVVLEREAEAGGCCRSIERDGFTFDYTGHLLHVGRPETEAYLRLVNAWDDLAVHQRRAAVSINGEITPYPVQIHTHGLAPEVRRDCLLGFIHAWARPDGDPRTFREWVLERFGDGLARHFFFPYNRKLYRAEPEELSLDWVGRYVPKPQLEDVVNGALGLHDRQVGYNAVFRYPESGGIRALPDAVARRVRGLRLEHEVCRVHLAARRVELGTGECLDWDHLVFTGSLPRLLDMIADDLPEAVREARSCLRWVRVANLALGVEGPAPRQEHWLYYPDPEVPFYRVGFPSNHGHVAPDGFHTVSVELSLDPERADLDRLVEASEHMLSRLGLLEPSAVAVRQVTVIDPAYVVFDHHRRTAVATLRRFFKDRGVLLSGRWAEWKYSAMEDAVLDGMAAARRILAAEDAGREPADGRHRPGDGARRSSR